MQDKLREERRVNQELSAQIKTMEKELKQASKATAGGEADVNNILFYCSKVLFFYFTLQ